MTSQPDSDPPKPRPETGSRRGQDTKERLLTTAIEQFSRHGFDAASTRQIESAAGVNRGLITHHFGTKAQLWKAAARQLFAHGAQELTSTLQDLPSSDPAERMRYVVRAYVHFCARHPQFNRMMIKEGSDDDWRLRWLVETGIAAWYQQVRTLFNEAADAGLAPQMPYHHFYYALTGAASLIFCMAPESKLIANIDPIEDRVVRQHADALADLFYPLSPKNFPKYSSRSGPARRPE
jgi:AcrR family transcriptional regulator